jgi:AcrR family transcriptional regulator
MPMSGAVRRNALQQRVATAILEAAARVLVVHGEQANMADVATAAEVARATVYRYFPNRQALLDELAELAVKRAGERLTAARIDAISVPDGVTRAVRALVDLFIVLARQRLRPEAEEFESDVGRPLRQLVERGQAAGVIRDDIPSGWLTDSLLGLVVSLMASSPSHGREDIVAAISSLFLEGARQRGAAAA